MTIESPATTTIDLRDAVTLHRLVLASEGRTAATQRQVQVLRGSVPAVSGAAGVVPAVIQADVAAKQMFYTLVTTAG